MRGRLPLPPIPGKTVGGGVPDAPRRLAPTSFPGLPPAETPAAANNSPCLPPWGKVAPQGRMRGRLPLPPIPGQTVGGSVPDAPRRLAPTSFPGYHPRRLPLPPTPAEGSRPLPTDRTIDGGLRKPPGRACPAPTVRRPGNGCPRKPRGRFHIPIRRAGCPHPAAASRRRQHPGRDESLHYSPCLPPWGKVAPQGRMRGRLPLPPIPGQTAGGGVPAAPRKLAPPSIPRVITRGDSHCRQHPRRGQDPSLRTEPLTGVRVTPRAGHARPLPRGGPETGARVNPAGVSISPSVGRGAPTPPRPPAAANTPGGMNPSTTTLAFPLGGRWPRRAG